MAEEVKKDADGNPGKKPDETVGEIIKKAGEEGGDKKPAADTENVPLATFLGMKKDAQKFEKLYNDLKARSESGDASKEDVSEELNALAEEFDIEPKFVSKLAKILDAKAEKKVGESMKPILEQNEKLTKKEKDDLIEKAFTKHYAEALETMPEYKDIANAAAIKALSLLPENSNKTFAQLIEETYGKAITGKRTIEPIKPGGGKEPAALDMDRARRDPNYFSEVMADPALKAEYNKKMLEPNRRS